MVRFMEMRDRPVTLLDGDIVRQKEDLKKDNILRSTNVKLDDTKVTGASGSIDILSVVYKTGESLTIEAKEGGKVTGEVVSHGRHNKIKIVKFNRRKHHRKETGHRQWFTEVKITGIKA